MLRLSARTQIERRCLRKRKWLSVTRRIRVTRAFRMLAVLLVVSCTERTVNAPPVSTDSADLARMVTGEAAARLDASGAFIMSNDAARGTAVRPQLTEARASQYAAIAARDFGPLTRSDIEKERGGRVDFSSLAPCGRTFYAESPLPDLPVEVSDAARRGYGPWWLVTLCQGGDPAVSVATSAYNTHLTITDGKLRYPAVSGNEFWIIGIPHSLGHLPLSPEEAVRFASTATGVAIAQVPRLLAPLPRDGMPHMSRWQLTLERPVTARGVSSRSAQVNTSVFVRRRTVRDSVTAEIPASDGPETFNIRWTKPPTIGSKLSAWDRQEGSVIVRARQGHALKFERAILTGGQ